MEQWQDRPAAASSSRTRFAATAVAIAVVVLASLVGFLAWQARADGRAEDSRQQRAAQSEALAEVSGPVDVVYEVEGDGTYFSMTAQSPTGTVQSQPKMPLRRTDGKPMVQTFERGEFVYLSGQSQNGTSITCRIKVDGEVISENTSTGEFAIATCEGRT